MTQHRPIVLRNGRLTELPAGDTVVGAGFDPSALPSATEALPEAFLVRQSGVWVVASFEQVLGWMSSGTAHPSGTLVLTEYGMGILTEAGENLVQE